MAAGDLVSNTARDPAATIPRKQTENSVIIYPDYSLIGMEPVNMSTPVWFVNFLKTIYPTRHSLAKLTRIPLIGSLVDHLLFRGDEIYVLPRDQTIQINEPLDQPQSTIIPSRVVEHYINKANHHWIMDFCICRDGDDCQDYPHELGCLFLGKPVLQINSKLGRLVTKEEALEHARRCREAGLVHTIGSNRLDSVWLGVTPTEEMMTICNCCPCCCLWGLVTELTPRIGNKVTRMPGVNVFVSDTCTGCGNCQDEICFAEAIQLNNGKAEIGPECRGCGRCVENCPEGAIILTIEGEDHFQGMLNRLDNLVDLD
jgi:ferredoxin